MNRKIKETSIYDAPSNDYIVLDDPKDIEESDKMWEEGREKIQSKKHLLDAYFPDPGLLYRPKTLWTKGSTFGLSSNFRILEVREEEEELIWSDLPGLVNALLNEETFLNHKIITHPRIT